MKSISTALQTLFATRQFLQANLFQFNMIDGTSYCYTSADSSIVYSGNTFQSGGSVGPFFDRKSNKAKAHWKIGVEVDTLMFDVIPGSYTIYGVPFLQAIRDGQFDGAELLLHRAYWSEQAFAPVLTPTGVIANIFVGRVAEIDVGRSMATFSITSHLELLNQNMPVEIYQSGCLNTLYNSACTLNQASYAVNATLLTGSTAGSLNFTLGQASGYFALGKLKCTAGVNVGVWRGIKSHTSGSPAVVSLSSPFPNTPSTGDTFTLYPGCDKSMTTCSSKFSNLQNFRGMPFIPENQTAV